MDLDYRELRDCCELRFVFVQWTNLECIIVLVVHKGLTFGFFLFVFVFCLFFCFSPHPPCPSPQSQTEDTSYCGYFGIQIGIGKQ